MDIRPTQLEDLPELSAFLTEQQMARSAGVLRWKYRLDKIDTDRPCSWICRYDDQIVGHIGANPTQWHSPDGSVQDGAWFVDWVVCAELRSRGIGIFLLREAEQCHGGLLTVQGSADTRNALPQLHWTFSNSAFVYKLNVSGGAMPSENSRWKRAAAELGRILYYHPVEFDAPAGMTLEDIDRWDEISDIFNQRKDPDDDEIAYFVRSAETLRYDLADHPADCYRLMIARDDKQRPTGYAIYRMYTLSGRKIARLVDVFILSSESKAWNWLIAAAGKQLVKQNVHQIECLAGSGSPLAGALSRNRYLARQIMPLWFSPSIAALSERTRWHVTYLDSDIDTAAALSENDTVHGGIAG